MNASSFTPLHSAHNILVEMTGCESEGDWIGKWNWRTATANNSAAAFDARRLL